MKCCQMKIRDDSTGSRRNTLWQPSPPTKMTASRDHRRGRQPDPPPPHPAVMSVLARATLHRNG
ncbi:hypothetical protein ACFVRU_09215 [Streptomyces sp. NPDC057927]